MKHTFLLQIIPPVTGVAAAIFGGFDVLFQTLCIAILIDIVTGYIKAFVNRDLKAHTAFIGGLRKVSILAVIVVAAQFDRAVATGAIDVFGADSIPPVIRGVVCVYFIASENLSILENVKAAGVNVPDWLIKWLAVYRDITNSVDPTKIAGIAKGNNENTNN
jgi:toxin secretion/phage lysis holin